MQLDHDEELAPRHGMFGTLEAELEVQRTIKRAELTAFLCLLKKVIGPTNNKGIIGGSWKGEMKCTGPKAGDADLWRRIFELIALSAFERDIEFARSRRGSTRRLLKSSSLRANEKADELAQEGAVLDDGLMAQARESTIQQEREEVYAALQYAASIHSLFGGGMERL